MSTPPHLDPNLYAGEALIVFGSRAARLERPDSDWDILVVGRGVDRLGQGIDIVVVEPEQFCSPAWRDGELAGHVARWGRTLEGSPHWLEGLAATHSPSSEAIAFKQRSLAAQLRALQHYWDDLGPWARDRRALKLRRDLQRHARLLEGRVARSRVVGHQPGARPPMAEECRLHACR